MESFLNACRIGDTDYVRQYVKRTNILNKRQQPLSDAILNNHIDVVKILLADKRTTPDAFILPAVYTELVPRRHINMIRLLMEDGRVPDHIWNAMFIRSCARGDVELVNLLLGYNKVDPAFDESEALVSAVWNNCPRVVSILLEDGRSDTNVYDGYLLRLAKRERYTEIEQMLCVP